MKPLARLNTAAARAERKIVASYAAISAAYDKLDDIARASYKGARFRNDAEALALLEVISARLHALAQDGVENTSTARALAQHVSNAHAFAARVAASRNERGSRRP